MDFFLSQLLAVVRRAQRMAMALVIMVGATQAVLAASGFTPQMRLGYRAGDQWEPAMAAEYPWTHIRSVSAVRAGGRLPNVHRPHHGAGRKRG